MKELIVNGGAPLDGCPLNWDEANEWVVKANELSEGAWERPEWGFDCGFKLDYDGPIIRLSSRFYPPKKHYGKTWDGSVTVFIFGKIVEKKDFDCGTLEQLKKEVETYAQSIKEKIQGVFL